MCGIFGIINTKEKIDEGRVIAARDVLTHRGPDDSGIYISPCHPELRVIPSGASPEPSRRVSSRAESRDEGRSVDTDNSPFVALAHRRLSIIDLSPAAHQPMTAPDGRYTIVFNGEIYNYKDLLCHSVRQRRIDPESMQSNSDTEVILRLYSTYGKDCLNMLRGMFAFAIWDEKEKTLFAARDRFGIKPFYYLMNDKEFIFSSELKAIKHYKKNLTISNEGIDAFLRTGSVPAPLTIYKEVKSLLPGQYLIMHNVQCSIFNYWNFNDLFEKSSVFSSQSSINNEDRHTERRRSVKQTYDSTAKQIIKTALLDSVRAHMVADVEVGAFLSGGIDSTAIVSLMRQVGQEKIKTVSMVFPGNKLDESKYARIAAKKYNTEHIEIPFYEKDLLDDFENIMASMDQPTIDGINTYFVSKAAKQAGLKVVLSGLGGDELFGGYPSFINIPKYQRIKNLPFAKMFMKAAAPLLKNRLPAKAIEYMKNPNAPNAEYKLVRGLFTDSELKSLGWSCHPEPSLPRLVGVEVSSRVPHTELRVIPSGVEGRSARDEGSVISAVGIPSGDKRAGEPEKSDSNHLPFNTEHLTFSHQSRIQHQVSSIPNLTQLQYVSMMETTFYMRNQLLRDSDVFSMAHSLELRVPFVDHLLYESILPYIDSGFDKVLPKKMLVDAVGDIPLELINRPKMGFTFPFADWIQKGQLKDLIIENIRLMNSTLSTCPPGRIDLSSLNINDTHWSRFWSLYVLSKFI